MRAELCKWIVTVLSLCAGLEAQCYAAQIIYVDVNAVGGDNGSSWADAYVHLQDALADANVSSKPIEIRVAKGIYRPDRSSAEPNGTGNKKAFFQLISGVTLKGGYGGSELMDPNARDVELYKSILSGDLEGNDMLATPQGLELVDNSECVVDGSGTDRTAVLDGFVITRGYEPAIVPGRGGGGSLSGSWLGGGMRNWSGSPIITNCTFEGNRSGVENYAGSSPAFTACRFVRNVAGLNGGMVTNIESHPEITNCVFEGNSSWYGGVIYTKDGGIKATGCRFSANDTLAIFCDGGWLKLIDCGFEDNSWGAISITNNAVGSLDGCVFQRNGVAHRGGGIYGDGVDLTLYRCVFRSNLARNDGGGVYMIKGSVGLFECVFQSNSAGWMGGGIYVSSGKTRSSISGCVFESNTASEGGAVCSDSVTLAGCILVGNRAIKVDAGFYIPWYGIGGAVSGSGNLQLINCTLAENLAKEGPSVMESPRSPWGAMRLVVENSIIWDQNGIKVGDKAQIDIAYSDIRGGWLGVGNIDADPCFADPGYWDPNGTPEDPNDDFWVSGDYHLKSQAGRWEATENSEFEIRNLSDDSQDSKLASGSWVKDDVTSPCIDAGDSDSPIGLEPFPNGGRINMGAYGGTAEASKSYFGRPVCETIVAGDINGDCRVDMADFVILARHWLR